MTAQCRDFQFVGTLIGGRGDKKADPPTLLRAFYAPCDVLHTAFQSYAIVPSTKRPPKEAGLMSEPEVSQ
jgi:hypothetical protein